jgi:hypothetical protein
MSAGRLHEAAQPIEEAVKISRPAPRSLARLQTPDERHEGNCSDGDHEVVRGDHP